jgi:hypothetical protein
LQESFRCSSDQPRWPSLDCSQSSGTPKALPTEQWHTESDLDWDNDISERTPKDLNDKSRTFLGSAVDMGAIETITGVEE